MLGISSFHQRYSNTTISISRSDSRCQMGSQYRYLEYGSYGKYNSYPDIRRTNQVPLTTKSPSQVFELITGDYLFDPQSGTKYGKDDDHIAQIIELLGPFPKSLCLSGKWSQEIFNRKGELRHIHRLRHWALPDVLREKYHFNPEESNRISDFLLPMLELNPEKRADAGGMVAHPFMEDTPGMEGVKLDVPVGSRGEGIEGWAMEIKKR